MPRSVQNFDFTQNLRSAYDLLIVKQENMNSYFLAIFFSALLLSSSFQVTANAKSDHDEKNGKNVIEWEDRCARVGSTSVIKVNDDDRNKDPKVKEWFDIEIWSDSDRHSINQTLIETDTDTGIFEGTVFFYRYEEKSPNRVLAFSGDTIYAKYVEETRMNDANAVDFALVAELPILEWTYGTNPQTITYEPCTASLVKRILLDPANQRKLFFPAPLKQMESGLYLNEIQCKESLVLVARHDDLGNKRPACVTPETLAKLIERGWITKDSGNAEPAIPSGLQVDVTGQQQIRRGTTHDIAVDVTRDGFFVSDALVRITIEDYGKNVIRDFTGRTDDSGRFVFSWEIPKSFDDIKTLLAYVDVTDDMSAKTILFKFQVYCLPGETGCKVEGR